MRKGRLFAVSDIHGYGNVLLKLLEKAAYVPGTDRLIMLGDYINKGPDSIGTLHYIHSLCQEGAIALLGNNELRWMSSGQSEVETWMPFLLSLPLWAEENSYIFVHAGIRPGLPLAQQTAEDCTDIHIETFCNYILPGKIVVFGHTPTYRLDASSSSIWLKTGKIGIDTGAGHGYRLSLVDLTEWKVYSKAVTDKNDHVVISTITPNQQTALFLRKGDTNGTRD